MNDEIRKCLDTLAKEALSQASDYVCSTVVINGKTYQIHVKIEEVK